MLESSASAFLAEPVRFVDVGHVEIAYRTFGQGPPILFIHGWPLGGFTYRKLIPLLSPHFNCHVIDLPGAGETRWKKGTDFSFSGQAKNLARFVEKLELASYDVIAHDTGATIARHLALIAGERINRLVLIGTEIPGHRPPWIRLFQMTAALPGSGFVFRTLLGSRAFLRSSMGFGNVFFDRALIDGDFHAHFVKPLIASKAKMEGQLEYLRGLDWTALDDLAEGHGRIKNPVLLIWGAEDPTFPVARARSMVEQFANCVALKEIPGAKLLVHEEKPAAVADHIREFLR